MPSLDHTLIKVSFTGFCTISVGLQRPKPFISSEGIVLIVAYLVEFKLISHGLHCCHLSLSNVDLAYQRVGQLPIPQSLLARKYGM